MSAPSWREWWRPIHLPTLLLLLLLRLLVLLPWRGQMALGAGVGAVMAVTMRRRRQVVAINLRLAFPDWSEAARQRLLRHHFYNSGRAILESAMSWWLSNRRLDGLIEWHGLDHLHAALAEGRGIILLSGHFTPFELAGRALTRQLPFYFLYKEQRKNPLLQRLTEQWRSRYYQGAIGHHDLRAMVKVLRQRHHCWYAPDQDFGLKQSCFAPFMGVETATLTTPSRLAELGRAVVLPYFPLRTATGYQIHILPPLQPFPSGDVVADATQINALIESFVRRDPAQYLWLHRRFRTRPEGAPSPYDGI